MRLMVLVVRRVATPGRVSKDRLRVSENRWLPTRKCVLEDVASLIESSWRILPCRERGVWIELARLGVSGARDDCEELPAGPD